MNTVICCEILELGNSSFSLTIFLDTFEETNSAFRQGHNAEFFYLFCNKIQKVKFQHVYDKVRLGWVR